MLKEAAGRLGEATFAFALVLSQSKMALRVLHGFLARDLDRAVKPRGGFEGPTPHPTSPRLTLIWKLEDRDDFEKATEAQCQFHKGNE